LKKQQKLDAHLRLPFHKTIVGQGFGKLLFHVNAYISKVKRLQVSETVGMEEYQYQHYFTVRHEGRTVATHFSWDGNLVFFQLWRQIFAEFIKYAKYFYYICIRHWEGDLFVTV